MDSKTTIQCNKLIQLENSILMYGIYNAETLEKPINTYTRFTTLLHLMKDCSQDNKSH